ncbi:hypothetical protein SGRIM128S_03010 [Streptomyces griseomycini]
MYSTSIGICWAPASSTMSGGFPALNRGWSLPVISWVPVWVEVTPHFFLKAASHALA